MAKVEAGEILFVDNKKINLEVPKKMGWQTFWFDSKDYEKSNKELEEFLKTNPPHPPLTGREKIFNKLKYSLYLRH